MVTKEECRMSNGLDISLRSHFSGVGVVFFSDSWSTKRTTLSTDGSDMTLGLQRLALLHQPCKQLEGVVPASSSQTDVEDAARRPLYETCNWTLICCIVSVFVWLFYILTVSRRPWEELTAFDKTGKRRKP